MRELRLPRALLGALVGGALAVSGAALQALLGNPLADPYLLGVSGGAACGTLLGALLGLGARGASGSSYALPLAGFLGALVAVLVVGAGASVRGRLDRGRLLLSGVVVNALASAVLLFLLSLGDAARTQSFVFWMLGSLAGATPGAVKALAVYAAVGLALLLPLARAFDALALGEETAATLGVPVETVKRVAYLAASLLAAAAVATTGIIGFVGLLVPHAVRAARARPPRAPRPVLPRRGGAPRLGGRARAFALCPVRDLRRRRDRPPRRPRVPRSPEGAPVMPRLEARGLSAGYGAKAVLAGVSVALAPGRVAVLLGENGSGKSTLLKALAGVLKPQAGEVLLDGRQLASVPRREAARPLGYLPQAFVTLFPMRALDAVLLGRTHVGRSARGVPPGRRRGPFRARRGGRAGLAGADIRAMSGGERQRVLLARVLAGAPSRSPPRRADREPRPAPSLPRPRRDAAARRLGGHGPFLDARARRRLRGSGRRGVARRRDASSRRAPSRRR